jgi:ubiquinol-cytochrome c reductase iron-sulfur subunit
VAQRDRRGGVSGRSCLSRRDVLAVCVGASFALRNPAAACSDVACVDVELAGIPPGKSTSVTWQGRQVFVRHRTAAEIRAARDTPMDALPDPQTDDARVRRREWIVVIGECTHAGCKPIEGLGDHDGWLCLCHGSDFDTSGRVRKGPALENLEIPPYSFVDENRLRIGVPCGTSRPGTN